MKFFNLVALVGLSFSTQILAEGLKNPLKIGKANPLTSQIDREKNKDVNFLTLENVRFDNEPTTEHLPAKSNGKFSIQIFNIVNSTTNTSHNLLGVSIRHPEGRSTGFSHRTNESLKGKITESNGEKTFETELVVPKDAKYRQSVKVVIKNDELISLEITLPVMKDEGGSFSYSGNNETLHLISADVSK